MLYIARFRGPSFGIRNMLKMYGRCIQIRRIFFRKVLKTRRQHVASLYPCHYSHTRFRLQLRCPGLLRLRKYILCRVLPCQYHPPQGMLGWYSIHQNMKMFRFLFRQHTRRRSSYNLLDNRAGFHQGCRGIQRNRIRPCGMRDSCCRRDNSMRRDAIPIVPVMLLQMRCVCTGI